MYAHINYHTKLSKLIKKVDKTKNETKYLKRKKKSFKIDCMTPIYGVFLFFMKP